MSTQQSRELSNSENAAIKKGLQQTIPKLFADYSTPLPQLLVSPVKNSLMIVTFQLVILTIVLRFSKGVLSKITINNAINNPILAIFIVFISLWSLLNYFNKIRSNKNIIESMKRLPEGATKMDYVSQTAVMSNSLRGGRHGGSFSGGFLGGMLSGSMGRRR